MKIRCTVCVHRQGESAECPKELLFLRLLVSGIVLCIMEMLLQKREYILVPFLH